MDEINENLNKGSNIMDNVKFSETKDGDQGDYDYPMSHEIGQTKGTTDRILNVF